MVTYNPSLGTSEMLEPPEEVEQELQNEMVPVESTETTDEHIETDDKPISEKSRMQKIFGVGGGLAGTELFDYSGGGFIHGGGKGPVEFYKPGGSFQETVSAPATGILDTVTDAINFASAGDHLEIPKVKPYENKAAQALRNISGLVIPSLALRGMLLRAGAKAHASKQAVPWLQKLGDRNSFQFISKFGADLFTGGIVDYVAEQNERDDNLMGTLKHYWPQTYQWIPDVWATGPGDTADQKRIKNVNEGAIFNMLASVVEGVAYLTKAGRSIKRTSKIIPSNESNAKYIEEITKGKFDDVIFDKDNPVQDVALRRWAEYEDQLNDLNQYFLDKGVDPDSIPGLNGHWDNKETLIRTKDNDGIVGGSIREAEIQNNIGSHGRIGSLVTERARLEGLEMPNLTGRTLVGNLVNELRQAEGFGKKLNSGRTITDKMVDGASTDLAATILNPRVDKEDLIGIFDEFHNSVEDSLIRIVGKKGINKAIKQLKDDLLNMTAQKARALWVTSEAGQVADMSEGLRLMDDGAAFQRTVDLMANRLEHLMVEKGLAKFEANSLLTNMNAWKAAVNTGDKKFMNEAAKVIVDNTNSQLFDIIPKAKAWSKTLRGVAAENPEFLKPLMLANEFTDGNVDSMFKLHQWAGENLSTFRKAAIDKNPEVPSIINKAMLSNIFNSMLSAFGTPIRALGGNITGLMGRGSATVMGAVLHGDLYRAQKASIAHFALDDTLSKALDHMRLVFRKASTNPKDVSYVTRGDIRIKDEKSLNSLRAYAAASEKNNEYGASALLRIYEDLDAMSMDPVLRFGGNSMTALDGFAKAVTASTEAKYIAIDKLNKLGKPLTKENLQQATKEIYETFFDANDMISNQTIDSITSEIALNADSPLVDGLNNFVTRYPAVRPFIMFPRTTANIIDAFGKWSPAGILSQDYQRMFGPSGNRPIDSFSIDEIKSILQDKGRIFDENFMETFTMLRHEVKGKAAIGSFFATSAFFAAMNDRCTGNGHYDPARQRVRIKNGWKPKSCKVPGTNKSVSYEWMGPIGDWLSLTIDIVDNFDSLSVAAQEDLFNKSMWILSSAFTNRSVLSNLEPLHDILQGNGAAAMRWMSSFGNSLLPLGGFRNELGRTMNPQLRQLRTELGDQIRNRNNWLDAFDPSEALPGLYSPVNGRKIGYQENWLVRAFNLNGLIKITDNPGPQEQFLIDIEYNSSPSMRMSRGGAVLEPHEISKIHSIMGSQGYYKDNLKRIQNQAENIEYTDINGKTIKGFINILKAQRRGLVSSAFLDSTKYQNIFAEITAAYNEAKALAESDLPPEMKSSIEQREYERIRLQRQNEYGDIRSIKEDAYPKLDETLNIAK